MGSVEAGRRWWHQAVAAVDVLHVSSMKRGEKKWLPTCIACMFRE
jgi:hypothetical protein